MANFRHLAALVLALMAAATNASAGEVTWSVRSESEYIVHLQFYSMDRSHVWPSPDEVYVLDDSDVHEYPLSCNSGEKVCYGAWIKNDTDSYWGSGLDGEQACEDCCHQCDGGSTPIMVLNR